MGAEDKVREVIGRLKALYGPLRPPGDLNDPFKVLIRTMLSQNTSYKNEMRAFRALEERIGVEPSRLASEDISTIEECIRPAGQQKQRAMRIKAVAKEILEKYNGDLWPILRLEPVEEARRKLMALPGVGRKTADIVLLFCAKRPVFPVDRHIIRIFGRLGFLGPRPGYEDIRAFVEKALEPEDYLFAHLALIKLGREICRARKPDCPSCPISDLCSLGRETLKRT